MKRIITTLTICVFYVTFGLSQENDKISVKGDFIQIDMKCTTAYRNFQASGKEYIEVDKILIRKSSVLSVVVYTNEVVITTSELSWGNATNVSKHYLFSFSDSDSVEKFYLSMVDKITVD